MASGPFVANFGEPNPDWHGTLAVAAEFLRENRVRGSILWLLTGSVLDLLESDEADAQELADVAQLSANVSHTAVFPDEHRAREHVMNELQSLGFDVHRGGPNRECYVEVHKPNGTIVVGIPGPEYAPESGVVDGEGETRDSSALTSQSVSTPLSDIMGDIGENPERYECFLDTFLASEVGIEAERSPDGSVGVASARAPDGRVMIRVCADPLAFAMNFPETPMPGRVSGEDALRIALHNPTAEGVIVCSATAFNSVAISRDDAARLIASRDGTTTPDKPWWKFW